VQTEEEQEETENEEEKSLNVKKRPKITNQNERMIPDELRAEAGPMKGGSQYRQMQAIIQESTENPRGGRQLRKKRWLGIF
jgi:hypothetical protein